MLPQLNWLELDHLISKIRPELSDLFVDRVIVPERSDFPLGYLKGEWAIRLSGRRNEGVLTFSIRPQNTYFTWTPGKGPKASTQATRSPFDLSLSKHLKGAKLLEVQTLHRERCIILWFSCDSSTLKLNPNARLGLVLMMIPAAPEAFLIMDHQTQTFPILSRSRTIRDESIQQKELILPDGSKAPPSPTVRHELISSPESYLKSIEKALKEQAFLLRLQNAQKSIKHLLKQAQDRMRQSETAMKGAEREKDWQALGDLLKSALGISAKKTPIGYQVMDYQTEQWVEIPCDPKLTIQEQVEKYYQNAKRKQRRIAEAKQRFDRFQEVAKQLQQKLETTPALLDWKELNTLERAAGTTAKAATQDANKPHAKKQNSWLGKVFESKDGLLIYAGRSKDENLELTFKHARGNDLWLHVRGKPGAHIVIPLSSGKSAPLDTLLDAAHLAIHYSGGAHWGKTEVDYTFKKYVKRIKDSTEASYTNNKTLIIEIDPNRLKRLLDQNP